MSAVTGSHYRAGASVHNTPDYATSNFKTCVPRLYDMAGCGPDDVDVLQCYENFTGGVLMSMVEHGFCAPDECNEFLTTENLLAPDGKLADQYQRRQPRRVLHARARTQHRGGAADSPHIAEPG